MLLLQGRRNQGFLWKGLANNLDMIMYLNESKLHFKKKVNVYDIFDFALDNDYSSLFTTLANNWTWLCQNTGVLNKVTININFTA